MTSDLLDDRRVDSDGACTTTVARARRRVKDHRSL
jgi:hypothetical protein